MNFQPLNQEDQEALRRNEEKSNHDHKWYLTFKTHFNFVMIATLYLYAFLLFIIVINFILPQNWQFIDNTKLNLMMDTIIKLSIGAFATRPSLINWISDSNCTMGL